MIQVLVVEDSLVQRTLLVGILSTDPESTVAPPVPSPGTAFEEPAPSRAKTDPTPFQLEMALERLGGDRQLLAEMAELFLRDCDAYRLQIQQAVANGDRQALLMAAHTLKGSASNFAAAPTCATAMALEKMAREGNSSNASLLLHELETALRRLTSALEQLCQDRAA